MSKFQKYQKEYSQVLGRTVWFNETKQIPHNRSIEKKPTNKTRLSAKNKKANKISDILKMRHKKRIYYDRLMNVIGSVLFKSGIDKKPFVAYLKSINDDDSDDKTIYEEFNRIYRSLKVNESTFDRGSYRAKKVLKLLDLNSESNLSNPTDQKSNLSDSSKIKTYLDFGCSTGDFTESIGSALGLEMSDTHGIDIVQYETDKKFTFSKIVDDKISHDDDKFDLVTAFMVFHHIKDETLDIMFDELFRVTKPGGILIIREHNVESRESEEMTVILDFMHDMYDDVLQSETSWKDTDKYYAKYKSMNKWDELLTAKGFSVLENQPYFNSNPKTNSVAQYMRLYEKPLDRSPFVKGVLPP